MALAACLAGCSSGRTVRLSVVDPGHFHASLVQKYSLPDVDPTVRVYAPAGPELEQYLAAIEGYNSRSEAPCNWKEVIVEGSPLETLPEASGREAVILAGNNRNKAAYILHAVSKGYNVLSDKPMAISAADIDILEQAYALAREKGLVIQELMTERTVAGNIALREWFSSHPIEPGSPGAPAVRIRSVHHFYKEVDGKPLTRPEWYYDIRCQGEGIADVTTHYIDMVMTECFPGQAISQEDVSVVSARHWTTPITREQFRLSTGAGDFPSYLEPWIEDGVLNVYANGSMILCIKGVSVGIEVIWDFEGTDSFEAEYSGFEGTLPKDSLSHEDHFSLVLKDFLAYIRGEKAFPEHEAGNTLTKYRLIGRAVQMANGE